MPGKGRSSMLCTDVSALRSCACAHRAEGLACCRTHLLSGHEELRNSSLRCEHTLVCGGQRLA